MGKVGTYGLMGGRELRHLLPKVVKLLGRHVLDHSQVALRGSQVLPEGQHVDTHLTEVTHRLEDL